MPWDTTESGGLTEALISESPFVGTTQRKAPFEDENPLAASRAFAARTAFAAPETESSTTDMEDEEVVEALPGHALEESLRDVQEEDIDIGETFESASVIAPALEEALSADFGEAINSPEYGEVFEDREQPYAAEEDEAPYAHFRRKAVELANTELRLWGDGIKKESEQGMRETLRRYWSTVRPTSAIEGSINGRDPWSAAFISTVMKDAGAGDSFRYAAAHFIYAAAAKQARLRGDSTKFWAYRINEVKPEPGDLLCRDRAASSNACSGTTYDNVDDTTNRATHSDVVTEVRANSIVVVGGNVADSVKHKDIPLDTRGYVAPATKGCQYFAIMKPPGGAAVTAPSAPISTTTSTVGPAPNVTASLPQRIPGAVRAGLITVEAARAIIAGERDESKLTNLIFYARHPELPAGHRVQPHEKQLVQDWLRIRDDIIRPLLRSLSQGAAPASGAPTASSVAGVNVKVIARIDGHRDAIERAAVTNSVSGNVLRGIIAAESGGDERTGAGGSGYKGLMQSDRTPEDLDPAVSTAKGAKKYVAFTESMRRYFRDELKQDFDSLPEETRIRIVMAGYNAGPGTVKRAMRFARAAGDVSRWAEQEHYLRALISTGAYNPVPSVLEWCVTRGHLTADQMAADLARLSGGSASDVQRTFRTSGNSNVKALAGALRAHLFREKGALVNDGSVTWDAAQSRASQSLLCAARFKQAHTGGYIDTMLRYKRHYDSRH